MLKPKMLCLRKMALLLVLALPAWRAADAHNVWVAQRAGLWTVVLGEGAEDDAYQPAAVTQALALDRSGHAVRLTRVPGEHNLALSLDPQAATLAVSYKDGYWSQTADGNWVAGSRLQVPDARKSGEYRMHSRTVIVPAASVGQGLGLPLEIVPLRDPLQLKRGERLPVRVLFDGRPLAGVGVISDYLNGGSGPPVVTDTASEAEATVGSAGLNILSVSHKVARSDRREADEDGHAATLVFALHKSK